MVILFIEPDAVAVVAEKPWNKAKGLVEALFWEIWAKNGLFCKISANLERTAELRQMRAKNQLFRAQFGDLFRLAFKDRNQLKIELRSHRRMLILMMNSSWITGKNLIYY